MGKRKSHSKKDKENLLDELSNTQSNTQSSSQSNSQSIKPPARKKTREEVVIDSSDDEVLSQNSAQPNLPPLRLAPSKQQQQMFTPSLPRTISQTSQSSSQSSNPNDDYDTTARKLNFMKTMTTPGKSAKAIDPMLVFARIRPFTEKERSTIDPMSLSSPSDDCIKTINQTTIMCHPPKGSRSIETKSEQEFTFSRAFDQTIDQSTLFENTASPLISQALQDRHNLLMFAYGVTNSGKTYTMMGGDGHHRGIIPRAIEQIFDFINQANNASKDDESKTNSYSQLIMKVSYLEIYNDVVYDLLSSTPKTKKPPVCRLMIDQATDSVIVSNLREIDTFSQAEAMQTIKQGSNNRKVSKTALNERSSRSHSVFIIKVIEQSLNQYTGQMSNQLISKISIVDLAGSERQNRTHDHIDQSSKNAISQSVKQQTEANAINQSLGTLRLCLQALRHNSSLRQNNPSINQTLNTSNLFTQTISQSIKEQKKPQIPPFRDSTLTRLFKDSFCGMGRTAMLVAVSTVPLDYDESIQALAYAAEATQIKFATVINQTINQPTNPTNNQVEGTAKKTYLKKKTVESSPTKDEEVSEAINQSNQSINPSQLALLTERIAQLQADYSDEIYALKQRIADLTYELSEDQAMNREANVALMHEQAEQYEAEMDQAVERATQLAESEASIQLIKQANKLKMEFEKSINQTINEYNQTINELTDEKCALEEQLIKVQQLYENEQSINQSNNQTINEQRSILEQTNELLTQAQTEHDQTINQFNQTINELNESIDRLNIQLSEAVSDKESLKQSINQLNHEHDEAVQELQAEIEELNETIKQSNDQSNNQSNEIKSLLSQIDELKSLNESIQQSMNQSINQAAEQAQQAESEREVLIEQHNQELEESINQSINQTIKEQEKIRSKEIKQLNEQIKQLNNQLQTQSDEHESEVEQLKQENQSMTDENQSINQSINRYQQLIEKFQSVCGVSIEQFLEQTLLNRSNESNEPKLKPSSKQSSNQAVKPRVNKRESMIESEDFINSVDIQAATPVKPAAPSRKGKRLSIATDASQFNQSNNHMKTAPASSIVHALNEGRSIDLLTSPAPQRRYYTINQSVNQSHAQPPSPSTRTRYGTMNQPTPMMSPAVMKVLKGDKKKTKTKSSNKENSPDDVFDFNSAINQINQSSSSVMESQPLKEKKLKKQNQAMLKAAITKTEQSINQSNNQSNNESDWDTTFGSSQPKYSRNLVNQSIIPPVIPAGQPTPVAKRTRNRTHS